MSGLDVEEREALARRFRFLSVVDVAGSSVAVVVVEGAGYLALIFRFATHKNCSSIAYLSTSLPFPSPLLANVASSE
jgi:hypothetical protein